MTDALRHIRRLIIELDEHEADRVIGWTIGLDELIYQRTMLMPEGIRLIRSLDSCITINSLIVAAREAREPEQRGFVFGGKQEDGAHD